MGFTLTGADVFSNWPHVLEMQFDTMTSFYHYSVTVNISDPYVWSFLSCKCETLALRGC